MRHTLLIVGLDNPQSSDPRYALFPHPPGCAGHRLMEMMKEADKSFEDQQYARIAKTNLFPCGHAPTFQKKGFLEMAANTLVMSLSGTERRVVLLGNEVRDAVMSHQVGEKTRPAHFITIHGARYAWIPHPSGRNLFYNDAKKRRRIGRFLVNAARYDK